MSYIDEVLGDTETILGKSIFKRAGSAIKRAVKGKPKPKPKPKLAPRVAAKPKLARPTPANRQLARVAKTQPTQAKKAVGALAAQDTNVAAGVNMYADMKNPETKTEATAAYSDTLKAAQAGDPQAQKAVGTVAALAQSDIVAPNVPDTEIQHGAESYQQSVPAYEPEEYQAEEPEEYQPDDSEEPEEYQEGEAVEGDTMLGGLVTVGFNFGNILKKAVSAVKPLAKTAVKVASMTPYGAAINAAMSMAPAPLKMAATMLQSAQKGDANAKAKVAQVSALAKAGSAQGVAALKTLQQARELTNRVVREAKAITHGPTASLSVPASAVPGLPGGQAGGPVQIFILMPGPEAVKQVIDTARQAGSRFWVPATSLYQEGIRR